MPFPGARSQPRQACGTPFYQLSAPSLLLKAGLKPEGGCLWGDRASVGVKAERGPAALFSALLVQPAEAEHTVSAAWRRWGAANCSTDVASH